MSLNKSFNHFINMVKNKKFKIVGIGEILWDMLPQGKKLGGAPANFVYYASKLGQKGIIASRVGNDPPGIEILDSLDKLNLVKDYIQIDQSYPTGSVDVRLDERGQPDYIIHKNVAWDFLKLDNTWKNLAIEADVICFGTLAQRSPKSRKTIIDFLKLTRNKTIKLLDINLRQNFYSTEIVKESLRFSTMLKLNAEELEILRGLFGYSKKKEEIDLCRLLIKEYNLELICLTRGENGSILVNKTEYFEHEGYKVKVIDTVGAGDAFAAAMLMQYLDGDTLEGISNIANRLGSWVSSKRGPTPTLDDNIISALLLDVRLK